MIRRSALGLALAAIMAAGGGQGRLAAQMQVPPVAGSAADKLRAFTEAEAGAGSEASGAKEGPAKATEDTAAPPRPGPTGTRSGTPALPMTAPAELMGPPVRAQYQDSLRAYYDYHRWGLDLRRRTFEWQLFSSRIIFVVVLLLVSLGIYFAWVQFHADRLRAAKGEPSPMTELSAGKEGLRVSSPVLGVIILVISLAFFYLYLAIVYPISETY